MSKLTKKQVNSIKRKLGILLCRQGEDFLKSAFHIKPKVFDSRDVMNFLRDITGLPAGTISLSDRKYYLTDWQTLKQIIEVDWTEKKKWLRDKYDCDNHAFYFAARVGLLFDLNSMGVCYGTIYNAKTNEYIGGHAFCMPITYENNKLNLYCLESQTDKSCLVEKGKDTIIGKWRYEFNWQIYF